MYGDINPKARDMILFFYQKYFPDRDGLVWPYERVNIESDYNELVQLFSGRNYKEDYQILLHSVRAQGCTVPPLINAYMNLSSTMRSFGTCPNHHLAGTTDTGILITLSDLFPDKRQRYLESYQSKNLKLDRRRLFSINMKVLPWWKQTKPEEKATMKELKVLKEKRKEIKEEMRKLKRNTRKKQ